MPDTHPTGLKKTAQNRQSNNPTGRGFRPYKQTMRATEMISMKKTLLMLTVAASLFAVLPARAQGGCDDSPENPTLVLAGFAGGAFAVQSLRARFGARKRR